MCSESKIFVAITGLVLPNFLKNRSDLFILLIFRLVCAVSYTTHKNEMYFRKFFKFPVTKPIDVRTKFYNAEVNTA